MVDLRRRDPVARGWSAAPLMSKPFDEIRELRIGTIVEVTGTSVRVDLNASEGDLTRTFGGVVYPVGQVASMVKVYYGRTVLFAYVRRLRMESIDDGRRAASDVGSRGDVPSKGKPRREGRTEPGEDAAPLPPDRRILDADLFAEANWRYSERALDLRRGVKTYPLPGQAVYLVTQDELRIVYEALERAAHPDVEGSPLLRIGTYAGSAGAPCYADLDKLFGLHCAVLGSTGSGKSGAVAAILHAALRPTRGNRHPRIVVLDPHGEYRTAFGVRSLVYTAYDSLTEGATGDAPEKARPLHLPYWLLTADEFRDLVIGKTEFQATSEANIVFTALRHARLVARGLIEPARKWANTSGTSDGHEPGEPRPLPDHAEAVSEYNADTPDYFDLDELVRHVLWEQGVKRDSKGIFQDLSPSDSRSHRAIVYKLNVLRRDPRLNFLMRSSPARRDLGEVVAQLVGYLPTTPDADIRVVDLSGLPNEVAGPLTGAIARLLFQYKLWQTGAERRRDPVLLVCEEAHRYVPASGAAQYEVAQTAVRRIAREGRKYGVGLMLVSQRPSDIDPTVLSQCSSWVVLRLTNGQDQEHIQKFLPDSLNGLVEILPSLTRREAIFVGDAAVLPSRIEIRELLADELPRSQDVSFSAAWSGPQTSKEEIRVVVQRWRNELPD